MNILQNQWSTKQILWVLLVAVSTVTSLALYNSDLMDVFHVHRQICVTQGIGDWFFRFVQPANWFGIFTLLLIGYTTIKIVDYVSPQRPWIGQLKGYGTIVLVGIILLIFALGCR